MAQTQFDSNENEEIIFIELKKIALKNNLKLNKKSYLSIAMVIADNAMKYLDDESFFAITNLKK